MRGETWDILRIIEAQVAPTSMEPHTVSIVPSFHRLAYSIAESEALSGLSRSSLYRLMAARQLRTVQRGRRRLVPSDELARLCSAGGCDR